MANKTPRAFEALIVDDDSSDALFLKEGFKALQRPVRVTAAGSVDEALSILLDPKALRFPDIVLLDLRLPGKDGFELLERIRRERPPLACLPVIILSTSSSPEDVRRAYASHANCYIQKPMGMEGYRRLAHCLIEFWLDTATLVQP